MRRGYRLPGRTGLKISAMLVVPEVVAGCHRGKLAKLADRVGLVGIVEGVEFSVILKMGQLTLESGDSLEVLGAKPGMLSLEAPELPERVAR